jgi:hypothetical protein
MTHVTAHSCRRRRHTAQTAPAASASARHKPTTSGPADPEAVRALVGCADTTEEDPAAAWRPGPGAPGRFRTDLGACRRRLAVRGLAVDRWALLTRPPGAEAARLAVVGALVPGVGLLLGVGVALGLGLERVGGAPLAARSVLGGNLGTPEPRVPPTSVAPNIHSSTSPGLGTSPIGPSGL